MQCKLSHYHHILFYQVFVQHWTSNAVRILDVLAKGHLQTPIDLSLLTVIQCVLLSETNCLLFDKIHYEIKIKVPVNNSEGALQVRSKNHCTLYCIVYLYLSVSAGETLSFPMDGATTTTGAGRPSSATGQGRGSPAGGRCWLTWSR